MATSSVDTTEHQHHINGHTSVVSAPQIRIHDETALHSDLSTTLDSAPSIAVDPIALVTTECITVTSSMRKHPLWAQSSVSAILGGSSHQQDAATTSIGHDPLSPRRDSSKRPSSAGILGAREGDALVGRWGLRGKKGKSLQDNPLMAAFARLRADIRQCHDIRTFDVPMLLHPFLQVIRSSSTSAPITSLALQAITKFFAYKLIGKESPRLPLGMQLLSAAITHCRFQATGLPDDEIVLLRILKLMEGIVKGPGGEVLGDESICEMMETGLSMCCQEKLLSKLLRRSAEISMMSMCQTIFERLRSIEAEGEDEDEALRMADEEVQASDIKMDAPLHSRNAATPVTSPAPTPSSATFPPSEKTSMDGREGSELIPQSATRKAAASEKRKSGIEDGKLDIAHASNDEDNPEIKPYSLPSIRELFRVLVNLLDPHDKQHTDTMRILALRIIDVTLEVAGPSIAKHPSLASLARDSLCRNLFQLVRSDNMGLLNESLRVAGTLLATCRPVLKLQQELFLSYLVACLHPRVEIPQEAGIDPSLYEGVPKVPKLVKQPASNAGSGRSTPVPVKDRQSLGLEGGQRKPDAREAMVESIGALTRIPSFLPELFVNYDCETDRSDLCEDLIGLLSRNAFPDSATWSTTNVPPLCLDALLGYVSFIADRLDDEPKIEGFPDRVKLREQRAIKKIIIRGATKFNENPKAGIAYLASQGIIKNPDDPTQVAKFLRGTTRLSKKQLGEFISKKNNEAIMGAFMDLFDYDNKRVDEALREMLGAFRLPGESPLIERIVVTFSEKYCKNGVPEGIANSDAVYVLTYAIIMLNTDQHNRNVRGQARMTQEAFAKNLRGVNGGKDFDPEYLQQIFESIKNNEIILPDEHDNQHAFDYAWKELLMKAGTAGDLRVFDTNIYDADMFAATWKPVIATLSYVFMSASEDTVYQRVVTGFDQCAQIAARYGLTEALDHIVYCLATISTLSTEVVSNTSLNTEVQAGNRSVMVSETAVKFGRDYRAQLATVVLFKGVVANNETKIRDGWKHIIKIWLNLFINSLTPATFAESQSLFESAPIPMQSPSQVVNKEERANGTGYFSSFTSYLSSYTADDPPEPSDQELKDTLTTYDCLHACPLDEIFERIMSMPEEASISLVHALLEGIPSETTPVIAVVKPEAGIVNPRHRDNSAISLYNPSMIYILELASMIAIKNKDHGGAVSKDVVEVLQDVIRSSNGTHPLIVSRAAFYLLHVLNANYDQTFMRAPVILHTISGLDRNVAERAALPILKGLSLCLQGSRPLRNEMINIPDFWSTIRGLHSIPEAAASVFELILGILEDSPSAITADNYEAAILLLNDFATAGRAGAIIEQKRDKNSRRSNNRSLDARDNELVRRGMKAVDQIFHLSNRVPGLIKHSQLERQEAWTTYWSPIFNALSAQCVNPCREIRHVAFACLQRALLSPDLASPDHQEWTAIFGEVLFPLILQLMKPEVYHSDPIGMGETRVQAATLLCKIFLRYLVLLAEWDGMLELWMKILDIMDRLMNSGQGDSLEEAVPESLKNTILVMANQGLLVPPSENPAQTVLWNETWKRLDKFLPDMMEELFPKATEQQKREVKETTLEATNAAPTAMNGQPDTTAQTET